MSRMVSPAGSVVATTLLSVGPCYVTQLKTPERDGYAAVQIGYEESRKLNRPQEGHLGRGPKLRILREVAAVGDDELSVGDKLDVSLFNPGIPASFAGVVPKSNGNTLTL